MRHARKPKRSTEALHGAGFPVARPYALCEDESVIGTAFTTRTFRYLAVPRYPSGNNNAPPGLFSILNEPGIDPKTGLNIGPPKAASSTSWCSLSFHVQAGRFHCSPARGASAGTDAAAAGVHANGAHLTRAPR